MCYLWRCPGRWPVCIQLYGQGEQAPIDRLCTHILAFRGLSACQGSLNSSKIVVNEVGLTCLKCPWIQCFQGIIRFRLDFSGKIQPPCHQILTGRHAGSASAPMIFEHHPPFCQPVQIWHQCSLIPVIVVQIQHSAIHRIAKYKDCFHSIYPFLLSCSNICIYFTKSQISVSLLLFQIFHKKLQIF